MTHTDVQWLLYLQDYLVQVGVTPSSVVTNCKILVVRYGLGNFLSGCLIQLAIDKLTNVSLASIDNLINVSLAYLQLG